MRRGYCAGYGNNPPASVLRKKELHNFFITSLCGLRLEKPIHRRSVLEEVAIQGLYYQEKVRVTWWASLLQKLGCLHACLASSGLVVVASHHQQGSGSLPRLHVAPSTTLLADSRH